MLDMLSILSVTLPCLFVVVRAVLLDRQLPWFRPEVGDASKPEQSTSLRSRRG